MPKKSSVKAESVAPFIDHEAIEKRAAHFMDTSKAAANSLQKYIDILRNAGFFETGQEIVLVENEQGRLFLDSRGMLNCTHRLFYDPSYPLQDRPEFSYPEKIDTTKAIISFDVRDCGKRIAEKLDSLLPLVELNKRHLENDLESVIMKVEERKRLNAKS